MFVASCRLIQGAIRVKVHRIDVHMQRPVFFLHRSRARAPTPTSAPYLCVQGGLENRPAIRGACASIARVLPSCKMIELLRLPESASDYGSFNEICRRVGRCCQRKARGLRWNFPLYEYFPSSPRNTGVITSVYKFVPCYRVRFEI